MRSRFRDGRVCQFRHRGFVGAGTERVNAPSSPFGMAGRGLLKRKPGPHSHLLDISAPIRRRARRSGAGKIWGPPGADDRPRKSGSDPKRGALGAAIGFPFLTLREVVHAGRSGGSAGVVIRGSKLGSERYVPGRMPPHDKKTKDRRKACGGPSSKSFQSPEGQREQRGLYKGGRREKRTLDPRFSPLESQMQYVTWGYRR